MPSLRGTIATRTIRELAYRGLTIGVTENALPEDIQEFLEHGADGVVPKPFDMQLFKARMQECERFRTPFEILQDGINFV